MLPRRSLESAEVANERAERYQGKITSFVILTCLVATIGGCIFGYDIGVSGSVTSTDGFLKEFFHTVYERKMNAHENNYCKFDDQGLAAFNSLLYIAGLVATLMASPITRKYGRRASIICAGIFFLIGAAAVPVYLSEVAPAHMRGGLTILFQLATTIGIFAATMISYAMRNLNPWGWRLSLGSAAFPALLMTLGGYFLPETPNNLIERGLKERGRHVLEKLRGTKNVNAEFQDMIDASELANSVKHPFKDILQKRHRPQLVMAILIPMFQILTGTNCILFYAPILFLTMGFGENSLLYSAVLIGGVLFVSTFVSIALVDKLGRRALLISGGLQMIICQIIVAVILSLKFGDNQDLSKGYSILLVFFFSLFILGYGWSWGPLGWTIPSEIFPLATRSAGQSITVSVNLLFTFITSQGFLYLLCALKFGIFLFFAGCVSVMTIFVYFLLPETKGVPIEEMTLIWRKHWFWKKLLPENLVAQSSHVQSSSLQTS
ncbi:hypothetical protein EUTSA_v10000602mg [Eutrema salsugineum]|uniref:Major facilitator superfamily (MFS) profile domain-containing protein n=1 Tax=Eutrema salsugineum TaxID=72664 RepID=V4LV95_EUTSA|nr:hypothetical protein EUTSA_v10000602mg [Eutrema salsugineum]